MLPVKSAARPMLYVVVGPHFVDCALQTGRQWLVDGRIVINLSNGMGDADHDNHALVSGEVVARAFAGVASWLNARNDAQGQSALRYSGLAGIRVLVADVWLGQVCLPWNPALRRKHGAETYVREQFAAAGYGLSHDDVIRLDDAPYGREHLAVAYPRWLLSVIDRFAISVNGSIVSLLPFSIAAWALRPKERGKKLAAVGLACEGMSLITYGAGRQSDVVVRANAVSAPGSSEADSTSASGWSGVSALWRRMQLRDPQLLCLERLPVVSLTSCQGIEQTLGDSLFAMDLSEQQIDSAPSAALRLLHSSTALRSPLDAKPSRQSLSPVGWGATALGSFFVALLISNSWQAAQLKHSLVQQNRANSVESVTIVSDRSWSREEIARIDAVNSAVRQLNVPVADLMRALQPPRDIRVALLSVEILADDARNERDADDNSSAVKIVGEARTGSDMANYLGFVGDRKPFSRAYLKHHEVVESAPEHPYRFTLEASWQAR